MLMTVEASCESMYMLPVGEWLHIQKFYLSFRYRRVLYQSLLIIYMDTVCLFLMTNLRIELDSILWLFAVCGRVILTVVFC